MSNNHTTLIRAPRPADPDRALLQHVVDRRIALRLGLSMPVAVVIAQLAGLGPREGRR